MTPLEKARREKGKVNYCDECERCVVVGSAAYCEVDGKLLHPIMFIRGEGTGPAWACKKRMKPITHYEQIVSKTVEDLADFIVSIQYREGDVCPPRHSQNNLLCLQADGCRECWMKWLREVDE